MPVPIPKLIHRSTDPDRPTSALMYSSRISASQKSPKRSQKFQGMRPTRPAQGTTPRLIWDWLITRGPATRQEIYEHWPELSPRELNKAAWGMVHSNQAECVGEKIAARYLGSGDDQERK